MTDAFKKKRNMRHCSIAKRRSIIPKRDDIPKALEEAVLLIPEGEDAK